MRAFLIALTVLWPSLAVAQPVTPDTVTPVSIHGSVPVAIPPPPTCPYSNSTDASGCANSPGGTVQHTNFFTSYGPQSGQTITTRTPANVAGVDYAVGAYTALGSMSDPSTLNSGACQYNATGGSNGGAAVICQSSASPVTISAINFGLHNCTQLIVKTSYTGTITIQDNNWTNGTNCDNATNPTGDNYFLTVSNPGTATVNILSNTFNGNYDTFTTPLEYPTWVNTSGAMTFEYNAFIQIPSRDIGSITNSSGTWTIRWNLFDGVENRPYQGHGEIDVLGMGAGNSVATTDISYNTINERTDSCACNTTSIYTSAGVSGVTFTAYTVIGNTIITNTVGGLAATGTVSGTIDNGAGSGAGDTLTVSGFTGPTPTVGQVIGNADGSGHALWIDSNISGSGIGSKWVVSCQATAQAPCGAGTWYPSIQNTLSGNTLTGQVVGPACSETAASSFGQITFTKNYCEKTGGTSFFVAISSPTCASPSAFSGNVDMLTGSAITGYSSTAGGC